MTPLTDKERRALEYLNPLMDAFAYQIGEAIHPEWCDGARPPRSSFSGAGSNVANALIGRGFVKTLRQRKSWPLSYRITPAGRAALAEKPNA
jgi:hypothetical protein